MRRDHGWWVMGRAFCLESGKKKMRRTMSGGCAAGLAALFSDTTIWPSIWLKALDPKSLFFHLEQDRSSTI
jgi:hypothetical protein